MVHSKFRTGRIRLLLKLSAFEFYNIHSVTKQLCQYQTDKPCHSYISFLHWRYCLSNAYFILIFPHLYCQSPESGERSNNLITYWLTLRPDRARETWGVMGQNNTKWNLAITASIWFNPIYLASLFPKSYISFRSRLVAPFELRIYNRHKSQPVWKMNRAN